MPQGRDVHSLNKPTQSIASAAKTASTNGSAADLAGYNCAWVLFNVGVITDGTHTPKLQDSADNSTFADVAAADQAGTLAAFTSSTVQRVSYTGSKRYLRAVVTVAGATTGGVYGVTILAAQPRVLPA